MPLVVECGREFSVRYCDEIEPALRENSSVLNIWFD